MFESLGHITNDGGYVVVRRGTLLRRWLSAQEALRQTQIPARALYGRKRFLAELAKPAAAGEIAVAVGGFHACAARELLHVVEPGPIELHVGVHAMGLLHEQWQRCSMQDADVVLLPSATFAESMFRPRRLGFESLTHEGLPVVDVVQAALDVWTKPMGGREQSRFIIDDVLKWSDDD
jgi:hypothetical protein